MDDFDELLRARRSIRTFEDRAVPPGVLKDIILDSTLAPSAGNEQPWEFVIVSDPSILCRISQDCKRNLLERMARNPDDYAKKYEALLSREEFNIFYNAPSLVYIVGAKDLKNTEINCTLAAGYFMLSAAHRGLGTCWISFARFLKDEGLRKELGLGPEHETVAPLIIGYPESIPDMPRRSPLRILKDLGSNP